MNIPPGSALAPVTVRHLLQNQNQGRGNNGLMLYTLLTVGIYYAFRSRMCICMF